MAARTHEAHASTRDHAHVRAHPVEGSMSPAVHRRFLKRVCPSHECLSGGDGRNSGRPLFDIQMPNDKHQSGEYHRQQGTRQLVDLDHLPSPNQTLLRWENAVPVN